MPFATINGIRINYLVEGEGPHLLMFAPGGWRSVISRWTAAGGKEAFGEMDGLATLSRHFTCIAYDRRESGLSGGRVEPLNWDLYVREAKELLDPRAPSGAWFSAAASALRPRSVLRCAIRRHALACRSTG